MSISLTGINSYQNTDPLTSTPSAQATTLNVSDTVGSTGTNQPPGNTAAANNNSNLSVAINQALAQINAGGDLSNLFTPASQQSTSDFMGNLLASLQGSPAAESSSTNSVSGLFGYSSGQTTAPVALNQSSPTIKLQTAIQNLITQLDGNSSANDLFGTNSDANASSGLANLQQSFNSLITSSGGDPSQASLQSFLKTVAANIQSSMSIGNLFDASA
jgi:hypothetical protein